MKWKKFGIGALCLIMCSSIVLWSEINPFVMYCFIVFSTIRHILFCTGFFNGPHSDEKKLGISVSFLIVLLSIALWAIIEQSLSMLFFLSLVSFLHILEAREIISKPPHGKNTLKYLAFASVINSVVLVLTAVLIACLSWSHIKHAFIDQPWWSIQFLGFFILCVYIVLSTTMLLSIAMHLRSNAEKKLHYFDEPNANNQVLKIDQSSYSMKEMKYFEIEPINSFEIKQFCSTKGQYNPTQFPYH